MKKIMGRMWVKAAAMVLCIISLLGSIACVVTMVWCSELPDYEVTLDAGYERIAKNYSAALLDNMDSRNPEESLGMFSETNMSYAVIKTDTAEEFFLKYTDLTDPSIYLYGSSDIAGEYEYAFLAKSGEGYYNYSTLNVFSALSAGGYWSDYDDSSYFSEEILDVVYVQETGLFYCKTEAGYYPLKRLSIAKADDFINYTLVQTEDALEYLNYNGAIPDPEDCFTWTVCINDHYLNAAANDASEQIKGGVTEEESTEEISNDTWNGKTYTVLADASDLSVILPVVESFCSEDRFYHEDTGNAHAYYWVLSSVDRELPYDDLFSDTKLLVDLVYSFSHGAIMIQIALLVVLAVSFVFLMSAAGRRKGDDGVVTRFWDRIPFGIYTAGIVFLEGCALGIMTIMLDGYVGMRTMSAIFLVAEVSALMVYFLLAWCMSIAVRIKAKVFWRYTLLYYLIYPMKRLGQEVQKNVSLFWKTLLVLVGIGFVQLMVLLMVASSWRWDLLFVFFFAYKVVEFAVIICIVLQMRSLQQGGIRIAAGDLSTPIDTSNMFWEFKQHGENINKAGDGIAVAVEKQMKSERFKTELITNVSHDIKTPLTSIINYVDLIKKEGITDPPMAEYIDVLDRQSARLKKLIEDLMEASKASTGNLPIHLETCDVNVFLSQAIGEFEERMEANELQLIVSNPDEPLHILADGRHLWRIFDNLLNNICKYAQPGSRVYINLEQQDGKVVITFRNISKYQLNISSEELMERFVRGDSSRNTEGSGLGLSISQSLTELMNGAIRLDIDGDLFKVTIRFPVQVQLPRESE